MVNDLHPPLPSIVSKELRDFLLQCFTKDIKKRPTAAALLDHIWILSHAQEELQMPQDKVGTNYCDAEDNPQIAMMARLQQLEKENENLNSTVRSLKMHLLKMMKDKKQMKSHIDDLEEELATLLAAPTPFFSGAGIKLSPRNQDSSQHQTGTKDSTSDIVNHSKNSESVEQFPIVSKQMSNGHLSDPSKISYNEITSENSPKAQILKPGDKCKIRETPNSGSWHRATVESVTAKGTIVVIWKNSGKKDEVPLSSVKVPSKEKKKSNSGIGSNNKRHVASIFSFNKH